MVAVPQKKPLSAASLVNSWVQRRAKKKKSELPKYGLHMISNISLPWDDNRKSVVAKREQIGLSWRDLKPFMISDPSCHKILADVYTVPRQIFDLENLMEVLSYEAWDTCLSEVEKNLLKQFLPKGAETGEVVQQLLAGENFQFGNSFLKWGASLCSGNLHPDAVLRREQCFKENKKAYYFELQKYHNDMIGNLLTWKEKWASCKDPEKEIVQKMWSFRVPCEKRRANESRFRDPEENLVATSESCSLAADEVACSSDQNFVTNCGELKRRKCFMDDKYENLSEGFDVVARPIKGEKLRKRNVQCGDGAKYMSYIKVSKEQHQRVKSSMKHCNNSIQSRSLNRVLGNLDTFHVQPFVVFEEEERQKLHDYWLQLAKKDVPVAFTNWRSRQSQKLQVMASLERELEEKLKYVKADKEKERSDSFLKEKTDDGAANSEPEIAMEDEVEDSDDTLEEEPMGGYRVNNYEPPTIEVSSRSVPLRNHQHMEQNPFFNGSRETRPVDLGSDHNLVIGKPEVVSHRMSEYQDNDLEHVGTLSSVNDIWPAANVPDPYYHSSLPLSLGHLETIKERQSRSINLESNNGSLRRQLNNNSGSFLSCYPTEDRHHRPEIPQQHFHSATTTSSNVSKETVQYHGNNFQEQFLPLDLRQKRLNESSIYSHNGSSGSRYSDPRQVENLSQRVNNIQGWVGDHFSGGDQLLNQNWFSAERRPHHDQSLFGLPTNDSMCYNREQFTPSGGNYEGGIGGVQAPSNNILPVVHPIDYLSGHETTKNNMVWMSLPHQNPALEESFGKPFLRPWNQ